MKFSLKEGLFSFSVVEMICLPGNKLNEQVQEVLGPLIAACGHIYYYNYW